MQKWMCLGCLVLAALAANAQDAFEIQVLRYETPRPAEFTFESHMNYVAQGTREFDGTVAPTDGQFHMTYELTAGLTSFASLGVMQLNAKRPDRRIEGAGWRLVPHFYVPRSWRWPVDAGLTAEFSFTKAAFGENSRSVEILPVLEKNIGRWELDFNATFGRALHGPGTRAGWQFEPAARIGYSAFPRFTPSVEYYSSPGEQVHQILPGGDLRLGRNIMWSLGVGVGSTGAGDRLIYKSRLEVSFGGRRASR